MLDLTEVGSQSSSMILLIEDDDFTARLITQLLAPNEVCRARNGEEGLQLFRTMPFEMVVTDIVMPKRSGLATIIGIRKLDGAVPILAITMGGNVGAQGDLLRLAESIGATATLAKPFERDGLMAKVRHCLSSAAA
jgi:DNA-binding response OmpR family regulator